MLEKVTLRLMLRLFVLKFVPVPKGFWKESCHNSQTFNVRLFRKLHVFSGMILLFGSQLLAQVHVRVGWTPNVCYYECTWTAESLYVYETSTTVITYVSEAHMYKDSLVYWGKNWVEGEKRRLESSFPPHPSRLLLTCTHCLSPDGRRWTFGLFLSDNHQEDCMLWSKLRWPHKNFGYWTKVWKGGVGNYFVTIIYLL